MMAMRWKTRLSAWPLLALLAVVPAACAPDLRENDNQDSWQAEVDRQLSLALADAKSEPELRDVGETTVRQPTAPPQASGDAAATAAPPAPEPPAADEAPSATFPPPAEAKPQPEPEPQAEPQPEPEQQPESELDAEPAPDALESPAPVGGDEPAAEERPTLPTGTTFEVQLEQQLNTEWSRPGDVFLSRLTAPLLDSDGREIAPEGAELMGRVTSVRSPDRSGNGGSIEIAFTQIVVDGESYPMEAIATTETEWLQTTTGARGPSTGAKAARGALGGALLGAILGGKRGIVIGAATGAAVGGTSSGDGGAGLQAILAVGSRLSCVSTAPFFGPPLQRQLD